MTFLCDTNVISEAIRPTPQLTIRQWLDEQTPIFLSAVTIEEIYYGLAYKDAHRQTQWFEKFLQSRVEVLPITDAIARQSGIWRGQFRKKGITRSQADLLIAATVYAYGLILATRNLRDFEDCDIQLFNPFNIQG